MARRPAANLDDLIVPKGTDPTPEAPAPAPTPDVLATEVLATEAIATEALATEVLATETLATEVLATEALATEVLATETLATEAMATEALTPAPDPEALATTPETLAHRRQRPRAPAPAPAPVQELKTYAHTLSLRMTTEDYRRLRRFIAAEEDRTGHRTTHQSVFMAALGEWLDKRGG